MQIYREKHKDWISHRETRAYRARKRKLLNVWIVLGTLMVFMPPPLIILIGAFAGCLSFAWLDETDTPHDAD